MRKFDNIYTVGVSLCVVFYLSVQFLFAQNVVSKRVISGKVTDQTGEALVGVSIKVKDGNIFSITNTAGEFSINVPGDQSVLIFTYVGYISKEVPVTTASTLNVTLTEDVRALDEVVVVGYGTTLRRDLTGSISSVKMADLQRAPVVSFEDALAGRVAGIQVNSSDGQPGDASSITIRGANSITQSNAPLYVIDGFPSEDPDNNTLNPNEIESIEVLKDASATAIYGARGANGVIMVTTKRGKASKPIVTYQAWTGHQQAIQKQEMLDPYEYVKYQLELNPAAYEQIFLADGKTPDYYRDVEGIDWQDQLIKSAFQQNHSLALRGGTDKTKYSLSGSYLDQDGIIINSGFHRFQGRVTLDQTINSNIKIGVNTSYSRTKTFGDRANQTDDNSGSSTSYLMYSIWGYRPVTGSAEGDEALLDEGLDPGVSPSADFRFNPLVRANNIYNPSFNTTMVTNAHLEYRFLKDFRLRIAGGYNQRDIRNEDFYNSNTPQGNPLTLRGSINGVNGRIRNYRYVSWLNENTLNYKKAIKGHTFEGLLGYTRQKNTNASNGYSSILLPNESLGINGLDEGTVVTGIATASLSTMESYLGRIHYHYKSKYYLTGSFRADGSSKFHKTNRWGYFPSAAVAWNFGEEDLIKKIPFISNGKLRMSYGLTGNNRVSDFAYLSTLRINTTANSGNTTSGYAFNNSYMIGAVPASIGNEKLKWETTAQTDIGIDLGFFKDRVAFTADYYYKNTKDLLLNADIAPSTGYMNAFKNIGNVSNRGLEFSLSTINVDSRDFRWNTSFNISFNRNKILNLNDGQPSLTTRVDWNGNFNSSLPYIALPGQPIALFYGFVFDGVYQYSDFDVLPGGTYQLKSDVPNNGNARTSIQPGDIKYVDINGDGEVNGLDQAIIGNPNPVHIGGFNNNFAYKNFDLNLFFQWSYGNDVLNANRIVFEGQEPRGLINMYPSVLDRWTPENPSTTLFRIRGGGPNVYSSRVIEDGSFLRFKTVSLGYTIPPGILKKYSISSVRVYCSAQNLITWSNYSGLNPDVSVRHSALTPGFDWSAYPLARTYVFGLNVSF